MFPGILGTQKMTALSETQINERLDTLYAMRDSGVLIIRHGDTSTQFRSMADLLKAIRILERQLNAAQGRNTSRVSYVRQSRKGYGANGEDC
jgi:uncharacterized beta-barrel protein YwiB (DUF1934 family)